MFVDRAVVTFVAGAGGDGAVSFRREKFVPRGGPDGGDGGDGGDIVLVSRQRCHSLVDFKFRNLVKAKHGAHGSGNNRRGRDGADEVLDVPPGTVVKRFPDETEMMDFETAGRSCVIARGGRGGRGNARFKSSTRQAPRTAESGRPGESIKVILELKLIAYAGLVGLPNAGKSTLISKLSAARPKIADYPFTTLTPHLGVVYHGYDSLVIADIPGIIHGAHRGEGMGHDFLRHIERTSLLIFVIDVSDGRETDPEETYTVLCDEMAAYSPELAKRQRVVAANKIDLLAGDTGERLRALRRRCKKEKVPLIEISALKGEHLDRLKRAVFASHEKT